MIKRYGMKHLFLFFFFIVVISGISAQQADMRFKHLSISDGLSQVCVNSIIQDKEGFIWIATHDGLNKYDGYTFKVFKPDARNKNSIYNNQIKKIYEDKEGVIWVGTAGGGLCKFDKKTETFSTYRTIKGNNSSISSNDVFTMFEDSKGRFWVGTFGGGLCLFNKQTGTFKRYLHNSSQSASLGGNAIRVIVEDHKHHIWIGIDGGGLDLYNEHTDNFSHIKHDDKNPNSLSNNIVMSILVDHEDILWIGTYDGGLNKYNQETKTIEQFHHSTTNPLSIPSETVWTSYENSDNTIWFGTRGGGLSLYNKKTNSFTNYQYNQINKFSISDDKILCIMQDKSGLLWIGTENNGINIYDKQSNKFSLYKNESDRSNTLSNNNVIGLKQQDDNLWIATRGGGLNGLNLKTGNVTRYKAPATSKYNFNQLLSIEIAPNGKLWLGSDGNGLFLFDPKTNETVNYRYDFTSKQNQISNNAITGIIATSDSVIWISTWGGGLNKYNCITKKFTNINIGYPENKNVGWCMYKDKKGILWVGTNGNGLLKFNPSTFEKTFYVNKRNNPSTLSCNVVHYITESSDGIMWIGTGGGGLNKFDRRTGGFTTYSQDNGLPNDMVLGIEEDNNYNLWLSTANGLCLFNPLTKRCSNYFEENGIQGNSFGERCCYKTNDGKLYFGGPKGLTSFIPDSICNNSNFPNVVISNLKIGGKEIGINTLINDRTILTKPIYLTDTLQLSYKENVISFEFAALDFVSSLKNRYQYKLVGFDEHWINADASQRFATYTNLPGGNYVLKVRACNSEGVWNKKGVELHIIITPPFYKRVWFLTIIFIVLLALIFLYTRIRERQITKKRENIAIKEKSELLQIESEKLKKSEDKFRKMFWNHNAIMILIDPKTGRIFDVNASACRFYNYSHDELCSLTLKDIYVLENEEEYNSLIDTIAFNQNKSIHSHRVGDGSIRIVEVDSCPFETENNKFYFSIIYDITDRRKAEKAMEETATRLALATKAGGIGVWDYDLINNQLHWDDQMYSLYGVEKNLSVTTFDIQMSGVLPDDRERIFKEINMAISGEKEFNSEYTIKLPNGSMRNLRALAIVEKDVSGHPIRIIGTIWDITDQKQLELELINERNKAEAASVAKSDFLATMSHEIRTPLNGVIGFSDILIKTKLTEKQTEYMKNVHISANSLLDLVNDILDFSKIEAGKLDLHTEKIDLIELAENIIEIMKFKITEKGVELLLNIDPGVPRFVTADPVRLRQVLINLLGNSTKFTSIGEIELKITSKSIEGNDSEKNFSFSVRDTGIGIPSNKLDSIFESFSQADSSTTRKYGGTGLGLAISSNLIKKMGSQILVESEDGKGSCFHFSISLPYENYNIANAYDISWVKKVMVIDDNATNRNIVEAMLKPLNIVTHQASTGMQALDMLDKNNDYDVLIVDYHMPYMDGLQVMKIIRQSEKTKNQNIIFLHSTNDNETVLIECKAINVKYIMQKPLRMTQLFTMFAKINSHSDSDFEIPHTVVQGEQNLAISSKIYKVLIVDDNQMNLNLAASLVNINMPNAEIISTQKGTEAKNLYIKHNPDIVLMDIQMPEINGYEASKLIRNTEEDQLHRKPIIALTAGTVSGEKERCQAAGMDDYLPKPLNSKLLFKLFDKYLHGNTSVNLEQPKVVEDTVIHFDKQEVLEKYDNDEEFIATFLATAFETMPQYLNALHDALVENNVNQIKFNAHSLKGMARGIGFNVMTDLALKIEKSCENDYDLCQALNVLLAKEFQFLKNEYGS